MKAVVTDKWILCPVCGAKTRTQILDDTELKHIPLFCPKCKESFIINVKDHIVDYKSIARRYDAEQKRNVFCLRPFCVLMHLGSYIMHLGAARIDT